VSIPEHARQVADELCEAVRGVSGFSAVVALLLSDSGANLEPAGWRVGSWTPGESELTEAATGDAPGARAMALGLTLIYGEEDNPASQLPEWVTSHGYTTAIVMPLASRQHLFGAVYAVRRDTHRPSKREINLAELAVEHFARSMPLPGSTMVGMLDEDVVDAAISSEQVVRDLQPLVFDGLHLDPVREQARIDGMDISLSRTEFLMLYTLGMSPDQIVPHHVLLQTCWPDDFPALSAVDATVYRLRKKLSLAETNNGRKIVKTVRGKGYMLAATSSSVASANRN
jgi:DNA-binding response OmpR family regulator